ncbi:MAG: hypothetical protein LLG04_18165, partial [Parachlamydia sp.]|nr:hypothetical protein [Parachlamydia sp.]
VYRKFRGDRGQWQHEYIVYPMPIKDFQKMFPERVKADLVEPDVAKPSILTSTELTNTKQQRQHEEVVEVVSSEEKQVAKNAHVFSKEFASVRSPDWVIPEKLFLSLFAQFGWQYVIDQAKYMTAQQRKAEKDLESTKKNKTPLIENPKKFLKIACEKNWADSDHKKEKK